MIIKPKYEGTVIIVNEKGIKHKVDILPKNVFYELYELPTLKAKKLCHTK